MWPYETQAVRLGFLEFRVGYNSRRDRWWLLGTRLLCTATRWCRMSVTAVARLVLAGSGDDLEVTARIIPANERVYGDVKVSVNGSGSWMSLRSAFSLAAWAADVAEVVRDRLSRISRPAEQLIESPRIIGARLRWCSFAPAERWRRTRVFTELCPPNNSARFPKPSRKDRTSGS